MNTSYQLLTDFQWVELADGCLSGLSKTKIDFLSTATNRNIDK